MSPREGCCHITKEYTRHSAAYAPITGKMPTFGPVSSTARYHSWTRGYVMRLWTVIRQGRRLGCTCKLPQKADFCVKFNHEKWGQTTFSRTILRSVPISRCRSTHHSIYSAGRIRPANRPACWSSSMNPNLRRSAIRSGYRIPSRWSHSCCTTRAWNPSTSRSIALPDGSNPW